MTRSHPQRGTRPAAAAKSLSGAKASRPDPRSGAGALQRLADRAAPVRRLSALAALQMKRDDVYNTAAFADPATHLSGKYGGDEIMEDAGSAGLGSDLLRAAARVLKTPKGRKNVTDSWNARIDAIWVGGNPPKDEQNKADSIGVAVKKLALVTDFESAAKFIRENSLTMAKGGIDIKTVRANAGGGNRHTFHRDSGFVQIAAGALENSSPSAADKAAALNGPAGHGWVQGHANIANWHHRFIEHVHVDKDDEANRFEIYNSNKEADGVAAEEWGKAKAALLVPDGRDKTAVQEAETGRKDSDLRAAKLWNDNQ